MCFLYTGLSTLTSNGVKVRRRDRALIKQIATDRHSESALIRRHLSYPNAYDLACIASVGLSVTRCVVSLK